MYAVQTRKGLIKTIAALDMVITWQILNPLKIFVKNCIIEKKSVVNLRNIDYFRGS